MIFALDSFLATSRRKAFHILNASWPFDTASHICLIDTSGFLGGVHPQALNFDYILRVDSTARAHEHVHRKLRVVGTGAWHGHYMA